MNTKDFIETSNIDIIKYFLDFDSYKQSDVFTQVKGNEDKAHIGYIKVDTNGTHAYIKPILKEMITDINSPKIETIENIQEIDFIPKQIFKKKKSKNKFQIRKKSKRRKKIVI